MDDLIQLRHTLTQVAARGREWMRRHPRLVFAGVVIALVAFTAWRLTRPGALFGPQDGTWRRVQINKDLYVGIDPHYEHFAEWTEEQIIGLEADIAREIGRRLGVEPQLLITGYDGLYDSLYIGERDMIISGLRVNPELTDWVYYTRSYFDAGQILVSRADDPSQDMRALDGKTVAVEMVSAGDEEARRWERRLHSLTIARYMLPDEAMQAVQRGEADAALVDTISARLYVREHTDLVMADKTTVSDGYVIAMRKANFRLTAEVEKVLTAMIEDGTLDEIIARWL
jgi:ABC-type amino acid transport substrate-binding protein